MLDLTKNLISFDIWSDFGFFKKPDINKTSMTYNLPPKPTILGIIGCILGMDGINKQYENIGSTQKKTSQQDRERVSDLTQDTFPEFYRRLEHLKIGIKPIGDFPFNKIINTYNSRNSYFYTTKTAENVLIHEQLLIRPKYKIYVYDQTKSELITEIECRLENNNPVYMPYLGKNEFIACFDNINTTHDIRPIKSTPKHISSMFLIKENGSGSNVVDTSSNSLRSNNSSTVKGLHTGFVFLENYPTGYAEDMHYNLQLAQLTEAYDAIYPIDSEIGELFDICGDTIYLF